MKHAQNHLKPLALSLSVVALTGALAWGNWGGGPDPSLALADARVVDTRTAHLGSGDLAGLRSAERVDARLSGSPETVTEGIAVDLQDALASPDAGTPAWDDVEEKFREILQVTEVEREDMLEALLGGPIVPTEEWLRERIGVEASEATVAKAWLLVNERNLAIQWESHRYYDLLAQKVQEKWDNGSYRKAQGELPPDPEATSGYYITQIAHNGWLASVHVGDDAGPELESEYQRLRDLIRDRNRALISIAKGG